MNKIITITLNPSLDVTIITRPLNIGYYNYVAQPNHLDASGQGVNVSLALARLNIPTHALVSLGQDAISQAYQGLIASAPFRTTITRRAGYTRSDTIILDDNNGVLSETHIIDESATCTSEESQALLQALKELVTANDYVVCAGTLPHGADADIYAQAIDIAHNAGAKAVVMTKGIPLDHALGAKPDILILHQLDVESLFNYPVRTLSDMLLAATKLKERDCKEVLIVNNDYHSIVLINDDAVLRAEMGDVEFKGTESGVIDALAAAYLAEITQGKDATSALSFGIAAMMYSGEEIGNEFASREKINQQLQRVSVKPVESASSGSS